MSAEGALGNLTKSASAPSASGSWDEVAAERSQRRWSKWTLRDAIKLVSADHRAARCGERAVPDKMPTLARDPQGRAYYANVRRCGCVWVCPHCAGKIGRARVEELRRGVAAARVRGLHVSLVTYTVGHSASQGLRPLLEGVTLALRKWRSGRAWQQFAERVGYVGSVRNIEVTWGEASGWHPHSHALLFTEKALRAADVKWMRTRWVEAVAAAGGYASEKRGLQVSAREGDVEGYLEKMLDAYGGEEERRSWAAPEELTYWHVKKGRGDRFGPFDLLRQLVATGWVGYADKWREYVEAFAGRRQLYWSKGLRDLLGLGAEASDQEIADAEGERAEIVWVFSAPEWRRVIRQGVQEVLLDVAERSGAEGVEAFVWDLMGGSYAVLDPDS